MNNLSEYKNSGSNTSAFPWRHKDKKYSLSIKVRHLSTQIMNSPQPCDFLLHSMGLSGVEMNQVENAKMSS